MRRIGIGLAVCLALWSPAPASGQDPASDVSAVVEELLAAISAPDTATLRRLMLPEAVTIAIIEQDGVVRRSISSTDEVVVGIGGATVDYLERGWEPVIEVQGALASVWLPYDFYIDGELSHCGVDAFQLIRTDQGWRVAALTYTVEQPPACSLHPDGPPGA